MTGFLTGIAPFFGGLAATAGNWLIDRFGRKDDLNAQKEAVKLGQYNLQGPQGNVQWTDNGQGGRNLNISLSPQEQAKQNAQMQVLQQMQGNFGEAGAQRASDAVYNQFKRYVEPEWERDKEALRRQLLNKGFSEGNEAYTSAFDRLNKQQERFKSNLLDQSVLTGNQVQRGALQDALAMYGGLTPNNPMSSYVPGLGGNYNNPLDNVANRRNAAQGLAMHQYGIDRGFESGLQDRQLRGRTSDADRLAGIQMFNAGQKNQMRMFDTGQNNALAMAQFNAENQRRMNTQNFWGNIIGGALGLGSKFVGGGAR